MVIAFACLGSFTAGIAVGMLIVYLYWCRVERELNEAIEKTLNKCNLTLDKQNQVWYNLECKDDGATKPTEDVIS